MAGIDLPLIIEAVSDFYRDVYADEAFKPMFKVRNMLVLRKHTAYFIEDVRRAGWGGRSSSVICFWMLAC